MTKKLAVINQATDMKLGNTPADVIKMAITGKADLQQVRELLVIRKEFEAYEATKVFNSAFATVQQEIMAVVKTEFNPQTRSKYADLNDVIQGVKPIYTKEGFSIIFYENDCPLPEHIRICADVLHRAGHKETYHYDMPLDGVGIKGNANMTKIHGKGSSTSYARRYLMCMIWNIPTQDDDGNVAGNQVIEYITDKEKSTIIDNLAELNAPITKFLEYMKLESLDVMPKSDYGKAIAAIDAKRKQGKK